MDKSDSAYKTIGEVAKILNLKTNKSTSQEVSEDILVVTTMNH